MILGKEILRKFNHSGADAMSIILYNSIDYSNLKRLLMVIGEDILKEKIEILQTLGDLSRGLHKSERVNDIAVLFIGDMMEFYNIFAMKRTLSDMRLILVLPNRSTEMISGAHRLHPRFISYIDSDFKDVADVLRRLIKLAEKNSYMTKEIY